MRDVLHRGTEVTVSDALDHDRAQAVADAVTALFEDLFADIETIRTAIVAALTDGPVSAATALLAVEPPARKLLDRGMALGAGFVAGRGGLSDRSLYLAWWQGEEQQLLGEADSPASGDPFDYTRREWFRVPVETGRRHVTGPYVDYVCTDEYVVTSTLPVIVGGRAYGVVGADVHAEVLEDRLLPLMREHGATLVGAQGRVVVSADHRRASGSLLDLAGRGIHRCGDLPLLVLLD